MSANSLTSNMAAIHGKHARHAGSQEGCLELRMNVGQESKDNAIAGHRIQTRAMETSLRERLVDRPVSAPIDMIHLATGQPACSNT